MKSDAPIEREILDYLAANPEAKDTARGIMEWWLLKQRIADTAADVEAVLGRLVVLGRLSAQRNVDGQVFYSLPEAKTGRSAEWQKKQTANVRKKSRKRS